MTQTDSKVREEFGTERCYYLLGGSRKMWDWARSKSMDRTFIDAEEERKDNEPCQVGRQERKRRGRGRESRSALAIAES